MVSATSPAPAQNTLRLAADFAALRSRQLSRYLVQGRIRFCTLNQLIAWSHDWARRLPAGADLIVGMPRSGLMVANVLAADMDKPLTTPELLVDGKWWRAGKMEGAGPFRHALVVDDSINTGGQMRQVIARLEARFPDTRFEVAVLLPHQRSKQACDHYYQVVHSPRVFEWDIMHTKKYEPIAFDFDGVLCEECGHETDQDEACYRPFLEHAKPLFIPQYEIDYIISNRLEKYRPECEAWLERHNVRYRHLVLWDLQDKAHRGTGFANNKVKQVLHLRPKFFVESSFQQSRHIALKTGVPVLCTDRMILFG